MRVVVGFVMVLVVTVAVVDGWSAIEHARPSVPTASTGEIVLPERVATATSVPTATATVRPRPVPLPTADIGQVGWLYATLVATGAPADRVPVANTPLDFTAYRKSVRANDDVGLRQLYVKFKLVDVSIGTKVLVIDSVQDEIDVAEVRFVDGPFATLTGWIDHAWIVSQLPRDFAPPTLSPR